MKALYLIQALLLAALATPAIAEEAVIQAPAVDLMQMSQDARCKQVLVTCLITVLPCA